MRDRNLTNKIFGRLKAIERIKNPGERTAWLCVCNCGNNKTVLEYNLCSGNTKSCGCLNKELLPPVPPVNDLVGKTFGRLTVLKRVSNTWRTKLRSGGHTSYHCLCECGLEKVIMAASLVAGHTKSCGCLSRELASARWSEKTGANNQKWNPELSEEDRNNNFSRTNTPEYRSWRKNVFIQDRFICAVCGVSKSGKMVSHHIESWSSFPEGRYDVQNGITLCVECHKEFHRQYGYGHNTIDQFMEFCDGGQR